MGTRVLGTASDDEIEIRRQRMMQERQMAEFGFRPMRMNKTFELSGTGCSGLGERWTGSGWTYCVRRAHCRAEETVRQKGKARP